MTFLSLFILVPVLMLIAFLFNRDIKYVRTVAVIGAVIEMALALVLLFMFYQERGAGNTAEMLFTYDKVWFESLNIHYSIGVDGISVLMILLTAIIIFTGTFASWNMDPLPRDFFMWLTLLSIGVYGFFISLDMFTMFFFYEIALIPMYLLIGLWGGTGRKEYSAMKLTLMLMGGVGIPVCGNTGGDILQFFHYRRIYMEYT